MEAERPTERDRYIKAGWHRAWEKLDEGLYCAPSFEVFQHGYKTAYKESHKFISPEGYAVQVVAASRH